jgi:hypothetical protein
LSGYSLSGVHEGAFGKNDLFSQLSFQNSFPKLEACQSTAFCLADTRYQASRLDEFSRAKSIFLDKFSVTKLHFTDGFLHTRHDLSACQVQVPSSYPGGAHVTTTGVTTSLTTKETIPFVDLLGTDITDQITVDPTATSSGTGHPPGDRDRDRRRDRDLDGDRDRGTEPPSADASTGGGSDDLPRDGPSKNTTAGAPGGGGDSGDVGDVDEGGRRDDHERKKDKKDKKEKKEKNEKEEKKEEKEKDRDDTKESRTRSREEEEKR